METKHTKGEWVINKNSSTTVEVKGSNRSIASTGGYQTNTNESENIYNENIANAKLIAAAPELLESLVNLLKWSAHFPEAMNDEIIQAKNAIKKATE